MPIVKCGASKATPTKGINYIMDPEKVVARGSHLLASDEPKKMAQQMMQTMHIHHKGMDADERKYYHAKVAFDPADRPENGGKLTPEIANEYAAAYATKTWPDREVVWAVQDHGASIHIHFIVAACNLETGKKLDARDAEYRIWKDRAQDLAKEYGLSTLDWRKATIEKRKRENQKDLPVEETFAEQGLKNRGRSTWKDELRSIIDEAADSCCSMTEFRVALESHGVILTRCTEQTISYKLGEHKACRGDTLGADYTVEAIQDSLQHNAQDLSPAMQGRSDIQDLIVAGTDGRVISQEEKKSLRELGRFAGITRAEVDTICDQAKRATWTEKQEVWSRCQQMKDDFWVRWKKRKQAVGDRLSDIYEQRREAKKYEWILNPRNRKSSLLGVLVAAAYFKTHNSVADLDKEIAQLKRLNAKLQEEAAVFKAKSDAAVATLRQKGLTLDEYTDAVQNMQNKAQRLSERLKAMTPEERMQYYLYQINRAREMDNDGLYRNGRKKERSF